MLSDIKERCPTVRMFCFIPAWAAKFQTMHMAGRSGCWCILALETRCAYSRGIGFYLGHSLIINQNTKETKRASHPRFYRLDLKIKRLLPPDKLGSALSARRASCLKLCAQVHGLFLTGTVVLDDDVLYMCQWLDLQSPQQLTCALFEVSTVPEGSGGTGSSTIFNNYT